MKNFGSKKKKRRAQYLQRKVKREFEKEKQQKLNSRDTSIEEMASLLGIQLK